MDFRWGMIAEYMPLFIQGMQMTLGITVIAVVLGTLIGLLMGMARLARSQIWLAALRRALSGAPATAYVTFFAAPAVCADSADSLCPDAGADSPQ